MEDRFKFRAIVKGYYYIDTPDKCEEFGPLIFLKNIDVLDIGDIGIPEEDLEIAIRKQYSDLQDIYIERMMENFRDNSNGIDTYITITPERVYQCTGLKDKNGKMIYEGDIIVIPNQYPFYCYKNEEDKKQDLNETNGEIRGESILNYIGIVENIFNCWQYVYHCVNPAKRGMSEGINNTLNDCGFDKDENSIYEIIGNIYENPELLED